VSEIEIIKIQIDPSNATTFPKGFVDKSKLDATTEEQIMQQETQDDLEWECFINNAPT
jgi:hypothetical protein